MDVCPHCHRRLLSHISIRCNWCGVEITDSTYLAQAEVERAASRAEDALHSLQSQTILADTGLRLGQAGVSVGVPYPILPEDAVTRAGRISFEALEQARRAATVRAQQNTLEQALIEEPAAETNDRFGHLEP